MQHTCKMQARAAKQTDRQTDDVCECVCMCVCKCHTKKVRKGKGKAVPRGGVTVAAAVLQ